MSQPIWFMDAEVEGIKGTTPRFYRTIRHVRECPVPRFGERVEVFPGEYGTIVEIKHPMNGMPIVRVEITTPATFDVVSEKLKTYGYTELTNT